MRRRSRSLAPAESAFAFSRKCFAAWGFSSPELVRLSPTYAMASFGSSRNACWNDRAASIQT